jgi:hypothetical protein
MKPTFEQLNEQLDCVHDVLFNEILIAFGYSPEMDIRVSDNNFFLAKDTEGVLILSNSILCEVIKNNFDVINDITNFGFDIEVIDNDITSPFKEIRLHNDIPTVHEIRFNIEDDPFIIHRIE